MMSRRRFAILVFVSALAVAGILAEVRRRAFQQRIDDEAAALLAAHTPVTAPVIRDANLDALPPVVQRWMRASGVVGTTIPSVVRITQKGEFRLGRDKGWMPMIATQHYTTNPPGFLWHASMKMFPLVRVSGRDRYVHGTGDIEMRIGSLIPVARKSGGNLDSGALLRFLNETMWFPAALLLPNVTWEPIDETSARATLTDADKSVSAVFVFDNQNRLVTMTADRWNDAEQKMLPWSTPITDWGSFEDIEVATAGTGVWGTGPDAYEYIRLRLINIEYDPV